MAQNHLFPGLQPPHGKPELERFFTPLWCTRALIRHEPDVVFSKVWEPCCGAGHIVQVLEENECPYIATDLDPLMDAESLDFLDESAVAALVKREAPRWIVTNPPYAEMHRFVRMALGLFDGRKMSVAMLLPLTFIEGTEKRVELLHEFPPDRVIHLGRFNFIMAEKGHGPSREHCWFIWRSSSEGYFGTVHTYHNKRTQPHLAKESQLWPNK